MAGLLVMILAMMLVMGFAPPAKALAEDTGRSFHFSLTADGADSITAAPNQVITVVFTLERVDVQEPYTMYGMQNEIQYDPSFFEPVDGSLILDAGIESADLGLRDGQHRLYMNFVSLSGGTEWKPSVTVGSIQLKVIAESGVTEVANEASLVSTQDGQDSFSTAVANLTVIVSTDCTVKFVPNGGSEVPDQTVIYGEKIIEPAKPTRGDLVFGGWYRDIDLKKEWDFAKDTVSQSMTLYARWATAQDLGNQETPLADSLNIPWWVWLLAALGLALLGLLAFWLLRKMRVAFESNEGSAVESIKVRRGSKMPEPEPPLKEGMRFAGWCKDQEVKFAWDFANDKVTRHMTLFAKWEQADNGKEIEC